MKIRIIFYGLIALLPISSFAGRCCINQFQGELPQTQPWLCHGRRLRTAQFCKSI